MDGILAAVVHGDFDPPARDWPQVASQLTPLAAEATVEVLTCSQPVTYGQDFGYHWAASDGHLFAGCTPVETETMTVADLAEDLYSRLFALIEKLGYRHPWRIWNMIPGINHGDGDEERYRLFCQGRYRSLKAHRPDLFEHYPSASAVGSRGNTWSLYFLAGRSLGQPIENPKQVSAYHYPRRYGPTSPSFSRAYVKTWDTGSTLFLSGTASIVGHESQHPEEVSVQARETLDNLRTLSATASRVAGQNFTFTPETSILKAYVRRPADLGVARKHVEDVLGPDHQVLYLQADICRRELLFEMDGAIWVSGL